MRVHCVDWDEINVSLYRYHIKKSKYNKQKIECSNTVIDSLFDFCSNLVFDSFQFFSFIKNT